MILFLLKPCVVFLQQLSWKCHLDVDGRYTSIIRCLSHALNSSACQSTVEPEPSRIFTPSLTTVCSRLKVV